MNLDRSYMAFVLGLFDTGLGAIRSLGRAGIPVVCLDFNPKLPGFKSKYCNARLCPNPICKPKRMLGFLLSEGKKLEYPGILFPASDVFVIFVSRYRDELQRYFHFILPSPEIVESIVNKHKQYEMAEKAGIPYPKTFYPENLEDVNRIKDEIDYPAFIKPYYSHLWQEKFPGIKGFKVYTPKELVEKFKVILPTGLQVMVQSIVLGPNTNHFKVNVYVGTDGKPLAIFALRKIRQYPTEFGVGTCVESIYYDELRELGLKFFKDINYRGIGSIEFKKDECDGKLKMIELNPRLWQQNIQATTCSINFPLIQYLDLTGQNPKPQTEFKEGIKWLDATADFQSFWEYFQRGELSIWQWLHSLNKTRSFATFAWDDMGPFFRANEYGVKYLRLPLYLVRQWYVESSHKPRSY